MRVPVGGPRRGAAAARALAPSAGQREALATRQPAGSAQQWRDSYTAHCRRNAEQHALWQALTDSSTFYYNTGRPALLASVPPLLIHALGWKDYTVNGRGCAPSARSQARRRYPSTWRGRALQADSGRLDSAMLARWRGARWSELARRRTPPAALLKPPMFSDRARSRFVWYKGACAWLARLDTGCRASESEPLMTEEPARSERI